MASDTPSAGAPARPPGAGWLGLLLVVALVSAKVAYWPLPAATRIGSDV